MDTRHALRFKSAIMPAKATPAGAVRVAAALPVLLVIAALLCPGAIGDLERPGLMGRGAAHASELTSDPESLVRSFDVEVNAYTELVQRFRAQLAIRAAESAADLCDDSELLGMASACVLSFSRVRMVHELLGAGTTAVTSAADRSAAAEAARVFEGLPPARDVPLTLITRGGCEAHEVAGGMLRESETADAEGQARLGFLRDLLWEVTGEAEVAGESVVEVESQLEREKSAPAGPDMAPAQWDAAAFRRFIRDFDATYPEVPRHASDFLALLNELSVCCRARLCTDAGIASSYAGLSDQLDELSVDYAAIVELVGCGEVSSHEALTITAGSAEPPPVISLPEADQLAFVRITADWQRALALGYRADDELESLAPECDTEELYDRGKQIAEQGQDPETGLDAGSMSTGGGGVSGDTHLRAEGAPNIQIHGETPPDCSGGSLTYSVTTPSFPSVLRQQETHTIYVPVTWSSSGSGVEQVTIAVLLTYSPGVPAVPVTDNRTSGSRTFTFTVDTSAIDFGLGHAAFLVTVQAAIECGSDSGDGTTVITQLYVIHSGN